MLFNVRSKLTADLESPEDKFGVSIGQEAKSFSAAFAVRTEPLLHAKFSPSQGMQGTLPSSPQDNAWASHICPSLIYTARSGTQTRE